MRLPISLLSTANVDTRYDDMERSQAHYWKHLHLLYSAFHRAVGLVQRLATIPNSVLTIVIGVTWVVAICFGTLPPPAGARRCGRLRDDAEDRRAVPKASLAQLLHGSGQPGSVAHNRVQHIYSFYNRYRPHFSFGLQRVWRNSRRVECEKPSRRKKNVSRLAG